MQVPMWCEAVCQSCSVALPGRFVYAANGLREIKADAKKHRWIIVNNDWLCCICQTNLKKQLTDIK